MLGNLTGWHLIIVLAIVLLLFGATKLPALSRSVGQSIKIFRGEVSDPKSPSKSESTTAPAATTTPVNERFVDASTTSSEHPPKG